MNIKKRKIIVLLLAITIVTSNYINTNFIHSLADDEDAGWFATLDLLEDEYQRL